ncbi:MAG: methionine gamma-lyase family protein [Firmicutes bacterium]|nr:methionine gamma-lyase family protein [Alicyclobacillaceae bacterium]MCL6496886.1 methionine gamma-lyase family protein [Bacillota bacterium]
MAEKLPGSAVRPLWEAIEAVVWTNTQRVLAAFTESGLQTVDLRGTTGYGYQDRGRERLDAIYARVFEAEAAMVRLQWVSGTHALATVLKALLLPGDELWVAGQAVYDTLTTLLQDSAHPQGLLRRGVQVRFLPPDQWPEAGTGPKVVYIQRSRGYQGQVTWTRKTLEPVIAAAHRLGALVVVDNCYGEFTEEQEPTAYGADLAVGSLIKNPGGGLAPTGAYVAGRQTLVEAVADYFFAPGLGREVGPTLDLLTPMAQGLFLAPAAVGEALMGAAYLRHRFVQAGYAVDPLPAEGLAEMVTALTLGSRGAVERFCRVVQAASPVDSQAVPEGWEMPGYPDPVIMAAGTFVAGASLELTCDAPLRPPYRVYVQGGLSRWHTVAVTEKALAHLAEIRE